MSPALAGRLSTTEIPGKPQHRLVLPLLESHVDGIKQSVFFCPWVFSSNIMVDFFLKANIFIWLCWVLVAALGIFHLHYSMWNLLSVACGIYFPEQGSNTVPLHWECRVLAPGPAGKSFIQHYVCERNTYDFTWESEIDSFLKGKKPKQDTLEIGEGVVRLYEVWVQKSP